ncbi:hypothetical protein DSM106972_026580 [Dulcicalothrix desertica PCC 7102]|uniref:Response regulatory domain-containing protein n=1 Tax=Dulcicalothrix desertica PCC 7102 TaxID=232991 RepID=A0A433VJZ9_9CYAN|nr:response regulator [Dulcicalothrix desertica]RUT06401.1 hypothetical protein DSM106972_026580 [Dulcicalothrix desertica PCC 7102]TWH50451.1 hypothetical protein CAL7102_04760 [Dulcicalothrix desertica PCC 7102]
MFNPAKNCYYSQQVNAQALVGIKVLIVDDDQDSLDLTSFILEAYGVKVITAVSALDALEVLDKFQPQILLSDIAMPYIDGYSLIRRIRQGKFLSQDIIAIAVTALDGEEVFDLAVQAGFQAYLIKPFEGDDLIELIASLHCKKENREPTYDHNYHK